MKIYPSGDRVLVRLIDPTKDKTEGGIIIPNIAQLEPKVFEAEVIAKGDAIGEISYPVGCRVLIPARILGDRLSDGTVFVKVSEIFGRVEDSKILEVDSGLRVTQGAMNFTP